MLKIIMINLILINGIIITYEYNNIHQFHNLMYKAMF